PRLGGPPQTPERARRTTECDVPALHDGLLLAGGETRAVAGDAWAQHVRLQRAGSRLLQAVAQQRPAPSAPLRVLSGLARRGPADEGRQDDDGQLDRVARAVSRLPPGRVARFAGAFFEGPSRGKRAIRDEISAAPVL